MLTIDAKKARIMETACKLFMSYGFRRVSMDEIARTAGVGKGTVYQLFESKQDLMLQTIDYIGDQTGKSLENIIDDSSKNPLEKLQLTLETISKRISSLRSEALADLKTDFPEAYEKLQGVRKQIVHGSIAKLLRDGKQTGFYDPRIDEMVAAHVVIGAINHIVQPNVIMSLNNYTPEKLFAAVLDIIMKGCLSHK